MFRAIKNIFKKKELLFVPRIKHKNFLVAVSNYVKENDIIYQKLTDDLILTFAIDNGTSFETVTKFHLQKAGIRTDKLIELSYINGMCGLSDMKTDSNDIAHQIITDNNLEACSLLYPDLWNQIMDEIGGPIMAIFPHRDCAFYGKVADETMREFKNIISSLSTTDNHNLSTSIFIRDKKTNDIPLSFSTWPHQIEAWRILN
jgi:uncharacterized protein YtpQ (UPF0354 family)